MTYGVEVFSAASVQRLTPTDFIHLLVATGVVSVPNIYPSGAYAFVPITGMQISDAWLVVITYGCTARLATNGFTVHAVEAQPPFNAYYSVYKR